MQRVFLFAAVVLLLLPSLSGCGQSDAPVLAYDNGQPDPPRPPDEGKNNPASEASTESLGAADAAPYYPPSQADLQRNILYNYTWQFSRASVANWDGWNGQRTFYSNGTYVDSDGTEGTWLLRANGQLLMGGANGNMYAASLTGTSISGFADHDGVQSTFQMYR